MTNLIVIKGVESSDFILLDSIRRSVFALLNHAQTYQYTCIIALN